jgi:hypothetical protein
MDTLVSFFMQVVPGTPVLFLGRTPPKSVPQTRTFKARTRRADNTAALTWDLSDLAAEVGL